MEDNQYLQNFPSHTNEDEGGNTSMGGPVLNYGNLRNKFHGPSSFSTTNNENENLNHHSDIIVQQHQPINSQYDELISNHPSTSDIATLNTKPLDLHGQTREELIRQQELLNYYTLRFKQGVASIFRQWMALQLAIEHRWGGSFVIDKAEDFLADTIDLFTQRQTLSTSVIDKQELEGFLHEIMTSDFEAIADDGSLQQISELILTCYHQCMEGNESLVNDLLEMELKARKDNLRQKYLDKSKFLSDQARIASGDADVDSDSDSDMEDDDNSNDEMPGKNNINGMVYNEEQEIGIEEGENDDQPPNLMSLDNMNTDDNNNVNNQTSLKNVLNTSNTETLGDDNGVNSTYMNFQGPSKSSIGVDAGITLGYYERVWNDEDVTPKKKKQPKSKPTPDEDGWFTVGKQKK